ncbi:30S ribosomal protein [Raphidocelis subcapitata]|uniref:30S ribosomal protein 3, chloroplastic n=1 Tax=Raphidocelis subcapitata TaxID=307507 RepID=A0A2V0NWK5_9CHLO|nr:30S ribosomal protein [Raphidocelis subcapitata]|eukprot:GBF91719.1 30S ribosomal protein [Raphidocelis subcapitata]
MAALAQRSQRACAARRAPRPAPFTAAVPVALKQRHSGRSIVAAAEGLQPSSGNVFEEDAQRAVADALVLAELEKEFISGEAGSEETSAYLTALAGDKLEAFLDAAAAGSNAAVVAAVVDEAAAMAEAQGLAAEVEALEEYSPAASPDDGADPLALYDNETAAGMRQLVAAAKLSPEELASGMVPEDWDQTTIDWFSNKKGGDVPLPTYKLNFLWLDKNIAVAVDQVYARGAQSPLTEYFVWPRRDAWDELRVALEAKPWITDRDRIVLLNRLTEVINLWQSSEEGGEAAARPTLDEARTAFPDCSFTGAVAAA